MYDNAAARIWLDQDAPAFCLIGLGLDRYLPRSGKPDEESPINWSPHTWHAEIQDDCGVPPNPRAADRLAAALSLLHSPDEFHNTASGFYTVAAGLAADWFNPGVVHQLSVAELARAVFESRLIVGDRPFGRDVARLIHMTARDEGFLTLPHLFRELGVPPDSSVPPGADLSSDPDLAEAATQGAADFETELDDHLREWIGDLATRVAVLPLKHSDPRPMAAQLAALAQTDENTPA